MQGVTPICSNLWSLLLQYSALFFVVSSPDKTDSFSGGTCWLLIAGIRVILLRLLLLLLLLLIGVWAKYENIIHLSQKAEQSSRITRVERSFFPLCWRNEACKYSFMWGRLYSTLNWIESAGTGIICINTEEHSLNNDIRKFKEPDPFRIDNKLKVVKNSDTYCAVPELNVCRDFYELRISPRNLLKMNLNELKL